MFACLSVFIFIRLFVSIPIIFVCVRTEIEIDWINLDLFILIIIYSAISIIF